MREALACWVASSSACLTASPLHAQQYIQAGFDASPETTALEWSLADLRAASTVETLSVAGDSHFSELPLQRTDSPLVGPRNEDGIPSVDHPAERQTQEWADHVPREQATHRGFFRQVGTIETEALLFLGYFSLQSGKKLFRETTSFHFHDEGWFGKHTSSLGMDKLTHAFDAYLIAEILHMRLHKATNASEGDAVTAAILASALMAFNELSDGIEPDSGYSMQDITMNLAGAAFSVLRNTVPGLKEKVAFKIEIMPNDNFYSYRGQKHYAQQRFMVSFKGAGFQGLRKTPFRYVDLQVGYFGSDFLQKYRKAGIEPKRHLFVGMGLNLGELLFANSRSNVGRAAHAVLDYLQPPYTSIRYDTTGRLGN